MSGFSFFMCECKFANCNASAHKHCHSNIISYKIPFFFLFFCEAHKKDMLNMREPDWLFVDWSLLLLSEATYCLHLNCISYISSFLSPSYLSCWHLAEHLKCFLGAMSSWKTLFLKHLFNHILCFRYYHEC